jgi:hypothetical protein
MNIASRVSLCNQRQMRWYMNLRITGPCRRRIEAQSRPAASRAARTRSQVAPSSRGNARPDEMSFATGDAVPADLMSRAAAAPSTRRGQPIGVLRDVPVTQRGRMTRLLAAVAIANSCASRRSPREPDRARPMRRAQDRLQNPITVRLSSVPCRIEWRELARRSPECP